MVKKFRNVMFLIVLSAITVIATSRSALALTIDFAGTFGGNISYLGGSTALTGGNLPIGTLYASPPGASTTISITGGFMNFATGTYLSSTSLGGVAFLNTYGAGGNFSITGGISGIGIPNGSNLISATFATTPTFLYLGLGTSGSLSANLFVTYVDPTLAGYFGFTPMVGSGFLTQLQMNINPTSLPFGPGVGFTATQASANVIATIREPATLLLLGSGLTILGLVGMRRSKSKETDL